ncbi:helix-turn-helix domain-containing protein [Acetobacterium sp.]|uniref:helix-turn-helix domain-containing protein n=1 Tax=Acetobacterium sp. TaxID=1872094 RepID=UPI003592F55C
MRIDKIKIMVVMAKQGLNQLQLAEKTGMSRGNLSTIVNGKRCKVETVIKIATALGVDYSELLEEKEA